MAAVAAVPRPTAQDRIKAALWFAERGFGIFSVWSTDDAGVCRCPDGAACSSPGKHPVTHNGFKDATQDPDRIRTLLTAGSNPNYGMVCPDNVFALDVDADGDGIGRFARLEALHGPLPPTLRTQTANGQHVFLRWPEGLPRPLKKMFGYVTRWGTGKQAGYVIGPRSVHPSGFVYAPAGPFLEVAEVPELWARAVLEGEGDPTITIGGELPAPGGRHDWLRDKARFFRGFMDDKAVLRAALLAENGRLAQPKTPAEVERAIGEVFERFPMDAPSEAEDKIARRLGDDELGLLAPTSTGELPPAPRAAAYGGLLGDLVSDLADGTDASLVGLLGSLVAFCGALVPGQAYFHRPQTSSPFIALVGESSIGRKGTAMTRVRDAMASAIEPVYVNRVIADGLNSGEALITTLFYKHEAFPHEPTIALVYGEEYAALLTARQRDGSTLDPKMREAFDGGPLSNRRSNSADTKTVSGNYGVPALVGITPSELRARQEAGALQSGSANRWLYLPVVKRDNIPTNVEPTFMSENRAALVAARRKALEVWPGRLEVAAGVTRTLAEYDEWLRETAISIGRDLTRRFSAIAFRIALIHALVDRSRAVTMVHLERALALVDYARSGISWVFGETIGSPDADLLYRHLLDSGRLTKTHITREIIRDPLRRQAAIDELIRLRVARIARVHSTGGRDRTELVPVSSLISTFSYYSVVENGEPLSEMEQSESQPVKNVERTRNEAEETITPPATTSPTTWLRQCRDYKAHATKGHRQTAEGWICDICDKEDGGQL